MSKEKKSKIDSQKKETPFYFETIGFVSIIIVIIIFGKLGKIGSILTVTFMVTFGDWYWLFVLFILFYGMNNILTHKNFNFKSQKFIGYMIFCFGLLVFSHFSVHNLIIGRDGSYFSETWNHYKMFISSADYDFVLGGGVIGGIVFFLFYYLLGVTGVILIAIIIIILGFTMIINKSIVEIVNYILGKIKGFKKFTGSFNNFFKYEVGKIKEKPQIDIYSKDKIIPLKVLDTYQNEMNFKFQEKESYEIKSLIVSVFNTFNIEYREISISVSYAVTTYKYFIYSDFDFVKLNEKLKSLIEEKVIVSRYNNNVLIEIGNKFVSLLTAKNLLLKQPILNNYNQVIGINSENEIEEITISKDANMLIVGENNVGIKNIIYYMICSLFMKISIINYEFELYDESKSFKHPLLFKKISSGNVLEYLDGIIREIDEKTKIIKSANLQEIDEYNKTQEIDNGSIMKRKFIIINFPDSSNNKVIEDKLIYIVQMGRICGVSIIIISRNLSYISTVVISILKNKLIFRLGNVKDSISLLNDGRAFVLSSKGEVILVSKDRQSRIITPLITDNEVEKVINSF